MIRKPTEDAAVRNLDRPKKVEHELPKHKRSPSVLREDGIAAIDAHRKKNQKETAAESLLRFFMETEGSYGREENTATDKAD